MMGFSQTKNEICDGQVLLIFTITILKNGKGKQLLSKIARNSVDYEFSKDVSLKLL